MGPDAVPLVIRGLAAAAGLLLLALPAGPAPAVPLHAEPAARPAATRPLAAAPVAGWQDPAWRTRAPDPGTARDGKVAANPAKSAARAPAREERVWAIAKAEDTYVLRYGLANAPDPQFAAICQPAANLLQITLDLAAGPIKAGDGVAVSLASGQRRLELAATAFRGTSEGRVVVEAAVALEARVLDLFGAGEQLIVTTDGARAAFPLAGAKAKLPDFRRVCLPN